MQFFHSKTSKSTIVTLFIVLLLLDTTDVNMIDIIIDFNEKIYVYVLSFY